MSSEIVIQAKHLGKAYQLYAHRNDWLKQVVFGWWKSYFKPFSVLRITLKRSITLINLRKNRGHISVKSMRIYAPRR